MRVRSFTVLVLGLLSLPSYSDMNTNWAVYEYTPVIAVPILVGSLMMIPVQLGLESAHRSCEEKPSPPEGCSLVSSLKKLSLASILTAWGGMGLGSLAGYVTNRHKNDLEYEERKGIAFRNFILFSLAGWVASHVLALTSDIRIWAKSNTLKELLDSGDFNKIIGGSVANFIIEILVHPGWIALTVFGCLRARAAAVNEST